MKVTAQYFGSSLAAPIGRDVEHYHTLQSAKDVLYDRGRGFDRSYPAQESDAAEMLIWFGYEIDVTDLCPDMRLFIGPKGGIKAERL